MSPTPPSTTSSNGSTHSPEGQYRVVRKRNRVPLSCAPCRSRKLKCNRAVPCENCVKRGDGSSCTYAQAPNRKKSSHNQTSTATPGDMQNRIDRLEGLVLSLMTNGNSSQSSGPAEAMAAISEGGGTGSRQDANGEDVDVGDDESDTEQVTRSLGTMNFDCKDQKSVYISEAHWVSIVHEIAEVKQYFATSQAQQEKETRMAEMDKNQPGTGSALIFGVMKPPNENEILASFPSKYMVDTLVSRYFSSADASSNILHRPKFQREYARHWQDPSKSSIVWIGMVFAMMRIAIMSFHDAGDEPVEFRGKSMDLATTYGNSMAQCLVLADYTKPHQYLIETLVLHLQAVYNQTPDTQTSVWVLVGVIVRLAMRMGYHRDSKMFPNISVLQGEMRRRIWTFIRMSDLLFSFQVGLPGMIRSGDSDTDIPHNLYDEDFDEDCTELPPARPFNDPAPIFYMIAKSRVTFAFGRVLENSQKVKGTSYEEVMEIDNELRRGQEMIPEYLRVRPMSESQKDPPELIIRRFQIVSVYHKAQCVLHRPFLNHARNNPRYMTSRRTCIESSMELLKFQAMQHPETRPGGLLESKKWYSNSLSVQDYLLAGTILALDLYNDYQMRAAGTASPDTYGWGFDRKEEMVATLQQSREIWSELKDFSIEGWKAVVFLTVLLDKIGQGTKTQEGQQPFDVQDEKQNAAMTLGLLSSGMTPVGGVSSPPPQYTDSPMKLDPNIPSQMNSNMLDQAPSPFSMFGQMPEMQPFNLDWDAWDNYIQSGGLDPSAQNWSTINLAQLQQASLSPFPSTQAENGVNQAEQRVPYPGGNAQPNAFDGNNANNAPGGAFVDPNFRYQGKRPGQM